MVAEAHYIMANKTTSLQKVASPSKTATKRTDQYVWDSGQGLCNSKSMYKVDLHIRMMQAVI